MNTTLGTLTILAMLAAGASAQESTDCKSTLRMKDVATAMGPSVAIQPVFFKDRVKGFRVYGVRSSAQLAAEAIEDGTMITQVCGVSANEVWVKGGAVCCNVDTTSGIEVLFQLKQGGEKKVVIKRP